MQVNAHVEAVSYTHLTQHDDSVAKGNVISQSVTPGKKVSAGTAVNLVLSSGSDKVSIDVYKRQVLTHTGMIK